MVSHCSIVKVYLAILLLTVSTYTVSSQKVPLAYQQFPPSPPPPPSSPVTVMRAWNCHGRNQRELVDRLVQAKIVKTPLVKSVLQSVDRQFYIPQQSQSSLLSPSSLQSIAYQDAPQSIGDGQTISAPHMHAHVLEEIVPSLLRSDASEIKILDVGCGSGYLTACFGRLFQPTQQQRSEQPSNNSVPSTSSTSADANINADLAYIPRKARVVGIDIVPRLVDFATRNIQRAHDDDLIDSGLLSLHVTNGWQGWPAEAPYDAIHVGAAAASFPRELAQQLRVGGVLIVPLGPNGGAQNLYKVERISNQHEKFDPQDYQITPLLGVRYVPLVQEPGTTS